MKADSLQRVILIVASLRASAFVGCQRVASKGARRHQDAVYCRRDASVRYTGLPAVSKVDEKNIANKFERDYDGSLTKLQALAVLHVVTIIWGTQHAVIKLAVEVTGDPATLTLTRFGIATLAFAPFLPRDGRTWRAGIELGVWLFLGYALQAVGLESTSASRSAFLIYLNVKFVPLFSFVFLGRAHPWTTWTAAAAAVAGTWLLANDGHAPSVGDAWSVAAAGASAAFILRLEALSSVASISNNEDRPESRSITTAKDGCSSAVNPTSLTASSTATVAALALAWALVSSQPEVGTVESSALLQTDNYFADGLAVSASSLGQTASTVWLRVVRQLAGSSGWAVAYLGVVATAFTTALQTVAQSKIGAEKAALVYALDPAWGAFFAIVLLHERLGPSGALGAAIVLGAALCGTLQLTEAKTGDTKDSPEK